MPRKPARWRRRFSSGEWMVVTINYGNQKLDINLPDGACLDEFRHDSAGKSTGCKEFLADLDSAGWRPFGIDEADLFVVNDAYRATPTAKILGWLQKANILSDRARFLIASGCHAAPDETQLEMIFGDLLEQFRDRIVVHDAGDSAGMAEVGRDREGQPVYLNRSLIDADRIVVIGSVEPHYFAGFTGGRKSIFPGLCDMDTIVRNHNRAVSFEAAPLRLEGNPVEEHLRKLMGLFSDKNVFSIQVVMAAENEIQAVYCGGLQAAFEKACETAGKIYARTAAGKYDLVLAEARPPLDADLYQLQKSLENCREAVSDSGTVILFSPCSEGIGSESFYRLADSWDPSGSDMPEGRASFGSHKLYRVYHIGRRINVFLYSELPDGTADKVYFKSLDDPQRLINKLYEEDSNLRTALVRDSGQTVLKTN